jgi:hypothetical protein
VASKIALASCFVRFYLMIPESIADNDPTEDGLPIRDNQLN